MNLFPLSFKVRRTFNMVLAIVLAFVLDVYYSTSHHLWVPLTTVIILQLTSRVTLRQVLIRFIAMVMIVVIFAFIFYHRALYALLHDVALGGMVAIIANLVFFPALSDVDFRKAMSAVLQAYGEYLLAIKALPLQQKQDAEEKKHQLENLQIEATTYPEWVYAPGFNPTMQEGHQYFLATIERVGQVLYAMHYAARQLAYSDLLTKLEEPIEQCVREIEKFLKSICFILEAGKLQPPVSGLQGSVEALERSFQKEIVVPLELLDVSSDYLSLYALIYGFRDLRNALLRLSETLR